MRVTKTLIAAGLATVIAGSAMAGGFAPAIVEPPIVIVEPEAVRSTWGIILPLVVLGGLVAIALADSDS